MSAKSLFKKLIPKKIFSYYNYLIASLGALYYHFPAKKIVIIGITGTKGKTTSAFLLEHVLRSSGHKVALVSTVKNSIDGVNINAIFRFAP